MKKYTWADFKKDVEDALADNGMDDTAEIDYFDFSAASYDVEIFAVKEENTITAH